MNEIVITNIITAICTGSLSWLFTLKYSRKEAEASAMEHVQKVYQNLIDDLEKNREADISRFKTEISELKKRLSEMEERVAKNEKALSNAGGYLCALAPTCPKRKTMEISQL